MILCINLDSRSMSLRYENRNQQKVWGCNCNSQTVVSEKVSEKKNKWEQNSLKGTEWGRNVLETQWNTLKNGWQRKHWLRRQRGDNRKWNATTTAKSRLKKRAEEMKTASRTLALHKCVRQRGNDREREKGGGPVRVQARGLATRRHF